MIQFSNKFKKTNFGPFLDFPHFGGKYIIFKKSGSVTHNATWASNTMLSSRKTKEPFPRKLPERKMERWIKTDRL